jgi:long-chain acyl-CoA synthetase
MANVGPLTLAHDVELNQVEGLWVHRSIPALYQQLVAEWPHEVNVYRRQGGGWKGTSVAQGGLRVRHAAQGLMGLGVKTGDRVGVIANTRPEWGEVDLAILHLGAVTVGIYPSLLAADIAYLINHAGVEVLFLENRDQLKKVESVRGDLPNLREIVVFDGEVAGATSLRDLERAGSALEDGEQRFAEAWRALGPDDLATIIYTSGTTGVPKGAMLSHGNLTYVVHASASVLPYLPGDTSVAFLPMAHALQRVASYGGLLARTVGYFTESPQTLMEDIQDVEPTVQVSVPRIWEKLYSRLQEIMAAAPPTRRRVFDWGLEIGRDAVSYRKAGESLPLGVGLRYGLARHLVHDKLKERVFGRNIRFLTSGGAPIATEILEYFEALGLLILEGWGLTETAAPATLNVPEAYRFGTVGRPITGTEVVRASDGELLVRGPGVFKGYYRNDEATAEAFTEQGFFKTGDIGEIDADGFVKITDRKKNLIVLSNGKNVAPQKLENHFQTISLIGAGLVHGDRRNYLVGLFTLDAEEALRWASSRGIGPSESVDLAERLRLIASDPQTSAHIDKAITEKNSELPRFEQLKYWKLLPETWSVDDGSLTPTLKLKRRVIEERHAEQLDSFYSD